MKKRSIKLKSLTVFCVIFALLQAMLFIMPVSADTETAQDIKTVTSYAVSESAYSVYYEKNSGKNKPSESIKVNPLGNTEEIDGVKSVVLGLDKGVFEASFSVKEAGIYSLKITYHTLEGDSSAIQAAVKIDGRYPFDEAERIELSRIYEDDIKDKSFETDKYGNDIRPSSKEIYRWQTASCSDYNSLYSEPYIFELESGTHTISISSENSIAISEIEFYNSEALISYEEYLKNCSDKAGGKTVRQEAEFIEYKNSDNIYPTYEKTNASTLPISASSIKLNTIGQSNWSKQGQTLSWAVDVAEAGLYSVTFRVNQSYNENGSSYRRLRINGEVPFGEADSIEFPYTISWYMKTLGDDKPYYVWLEPGDIISLECSADKTCEISRKISTCLSDMSSVYRQIFVITGASPDLYTDYNLDVKIPTLMDDLKSIRQSLSDTVSLIEKTMGKKNSAASTLSEILETIQKMIDKPYDIQRYVTDLSDDLTSMGSLTMSVGEQPLELDCFYFTPKDEEIPNGKVSVFQSIKYAINRFLVSYTSDYGSFSGDSKKLKVWVSTGRDQLQIIQQMIENDFENSHDDVSVELSLVDTGGTLIQATIAGKGPDVALMIPSGNSINLAFRDALVDLNKYDIESIYDDFYESAWTPLRFKDGIYGIPETQTFNMLFYRTDIFEMLDIEVPNTWEEFYDVLEILQRNNLEVGIPEIGADAGVSAGISTFSTFLLQQGGTYYTDDFKKTAFNTEPAYSAFTEWVELYSKYGLDRSFDFFNRFRTGVMVLSVQSYNMYNQLYSAAPEIRGNWAMAPIPGTVKEDGSIDRSENAGVSNCMMLKSAEKKGLGNQAFEFMKWWTSADAQSHYGHELEATMGIAARYTPANKEAFKNIGWKSSEYNVLSEQFRQTVNFREVPGNYVLSRALTSAFRNALTSTDLPERQLELYNKDINDEMERKAKEFNLY